MISKRRFQQLVQLGYDGIHQARRILIFIIGGTVLLLGVAMIILPGPAILVIPLGLTILATEFIWARRLLKKLRQEIAAVKSKVFPDKPTPPTPPSGASGGSSGGSPSGSTGSSASQHSGHSHQ